MQTEETSYFAILQTRKYTPIKLNKVTRGKKEYKYKRQIRNKQWAGNGVGENIYILR